VLQLRKISLDGREVICKRRVSDNPMVSMWNEEYSCGGQVSHVAEMLDIDAWLDSMSKKKKRPNIGISKRELRISNRDMVDGYRFSINNAS